MADFSLKALFGVDASGMDEGLKNAADKVDATAGKIGEKVADKLVGMRDISNAIATALGINFEKIAEKVARMWTGMSKEEEEALKALAESSDKLTELVLKNGAARLSDEQRYIEALRIRDKLQQEIDSTGAQTTKEALELNAKKIRQQEKISEIIAYEVAQSKEREQQFDSEVTRRLKYAEKQFKASMDQMSIEEKIVTLREAIEMQEVLISNHKGDQKVKDEQIAILEDRKGQLIELQSKKSETHRTTLEKISAIKFDQLSLDEKIASYQDTIETLTKEIAAGKKEGRDMDEDTLMLLESQSQLGELIKQKTEEQLAVEKEKTEELRRQAEAEAAKVRAAQMFISVTRVGAGYESQSTDALRGVEQRLQSQLGAIGPNGMPIAMATAQSDYGAFLQRTTYENELANVRRELSQRADIQAYARRYGESAARMQYGDDKTNAALRDMQSSTTRTAVATETLADQIAALNRKLGIVPTG